MRSSQTALLIADNEYFLRHPSYDVREGRRKFIDLQCGSAGINTMPRRDMRRILSLALKKEVAIWSCVIEDL